MAQHEIKTIPPYFNDVWVANKEFEVRKDDRNYEVGDTLILKEYIPDVDEYTGREITAKIIYKLQGGKFGIETGYCVLGFYIIH